jgi:integrase
MDTFEEKGWTRDYLSTMSRVHINTIYRLFKNEGVAEQTAQKVCDVLGILFEEGFEPSKPISVLSNKTIKHHHRLISAILNQAVYWQVIPGNPASRVKPPKVARTEASYLDEKQTAELLQLLGNESVIHRTMIKMFLYSGLRRGEMCGLEWGDIDFENHLITVCRTSQYVSGIGIYTKETKTETSDRTIKLPAPAFEVLKDYKLWQTEERLKMGDRWESSDRIFTQCDGKPIHPDSITGWFRDFISKTDLPQITIHSLRHTNITLLLAAGVPLRTVSYRAGHAQTSTTENLYAHAIKTADEIAADALDDILTPKGNRNIRAC